MKLTMPRPTRREFLATAGAAVAAPYAITSAALGAQGVPPASDRLTTALIGSGGRGQQIIAGGDRVVAVCDVDAKHRAAARQKIEAASGEGCKEYGDFREVLDRDDIDGVVVATPDHWHVPIAMAAVKAGKAVYCEKPLTLFIRQGRQIADVVRRYGAIFQVGTQQRSVEYERFTLACELVRNGYIGDLKIVRVEIATRGGYDRPLEPQPVPPELDYEMWLGQAPWSPYNADRVHYKFRFVSDYSGGDVTNWGAHHLDIAQWGIGADDSGPTHVEGTGKRYHAGLHDSFYDVHVDFEYAGGQRVQLRSTEEAGTGSVRFLGTKGFILVGRDKFQASPSSLEDVRLGPNDIRLGHDDGSTSHMGNWLHCVRTQNSGGLNAPAEVGHRSATVCHLANIAMELGRPLQWDPAAERFVDDVEANAMTWRPAREPWGTLLEGVTGEESV